MITANLHVTVAGELLTIRPIFVTDVAMEAEFVRKLSPQTRQYRFFGGVREQSPAQLKLFREVHGRHSMAFVATVQKEWMRNGDWHRPIRSEFESGFSGNGGNDS